MQFLYPIGLLALAGLIIPLIIHLWNVKQGKTLKIGSISLLGESAKASSKSLKINDLLLFVLRCLLLILVSFLLAQPLLEKKSDAKNKGGWILVKKNQLHNLLQTNAKTMDSLLTLGYELHDFNVGFSKLSLNDTINSNEKNSNQKLSYTSLLQEINEMVPHNYSVYLFAEQRLALLGNDLPKITYQLKWNSTAPNDTLSNWISTYAEKKYEASSSPSSTTYKGIESGIEPTIDVKIYDEGGIDRNYLTAALRTIGEFSKRKIEIKSSSAQVDVGFWLSSKPVSSEFKQLIKKNGVLFQYTNGKVIKTESSIKINDQLIRLRQRIVTSDSSKQIWSDGFGNPILTEEIQPQHRNYRFYSRLNPQWNDLVWNEGFVEALMPLVIAHHNDEEFGFETNLNDQRVGSFDEQVSQNAENNFIVVNKSENIPLNNGLWIAAFIVFLAERMLSFKNKKYASS